MHKLHLRRVASWKGPLANFPPSIMSPAHDLNRVPLTELTMPANRFNGFTEYGVGIGLRIPHYRAHPREEAGRRLVRDHLRKLHGRRRPSARRCSIRSSSSTASCSTASRCTSAPRSRSDREHLKRLKTLVRRTNTPWLSDHLCWGSVDGTLHPRPAADALHLRGSRK